MKKITGWINVTAMKTAKVIKNLINANNFSTNSGGNTVNKTFESQDYR